mmetsp:Transcript_69586/g.110532  ORF Transcript_69586/g.110532 Transcript_69586/m.110532 type:complete len:254 (+) Transcript_69586:52-813(+)
MAAIGPNGAKLFRNKTVNTVLVVPTKARKYRKALYIFNFVLTGFGLTCLSLSIVMLSLSNRTFFPEWAFQVLLAIAFIVLFIGGLGGRGAVVSFKCLQFGEYNYWLMLLTLLVGILIAAELVAAVWGIVSWGVISSDTASEKSDGFTEAFESSLKVQLQNEPELWWDWQKTFECCGYDNNTIPSSLATGKYCTTDTFTSANACKEQLWQDIADNSLPFAIFGVAFFAIQLTVCVSGMCLACIIKAQEPIYRDN